MKRAMFSTNTTRNGLEVALALCTSLKLQAAVEYWSDDMFYGIDAVSVKITEELNKLGGYDAPV